MFPIIVKKKGESSVYNRLIQMLEAGAALPGPPGRTFYRQGEKYTMDPGQYETYLERSSALARPRLDWRCLPCVARKARGMAGRPDQGHCGPCKEEGPE